MTKQKQSQSIATNRRVYIRLLSRSASAIAAKMEGDDAPLSELIEAGYLTGGVGRSMDESIMTVRETGITVEGRLLLQRLKNEEREESLPGRALKYLPMSIAYILGFLSPLLTDWVRALLK